MKLFWRHVERTVSQSCMGPIWLLFAFILKSNAHQNPPIKVRPKNCWLQKNCAFIFTFYYHLSFTCDLPKFIQLYSVQLFSYLFPYPRFNFTCTDYQQETDPVQDPVLSKHVGPKSPIGFYDYKGQSI